MHYTVIGRPTAELRLTELWIDSADRNQISAAADKMDSELRIRPTEIGESRWGPTRLLVSPPLAIYYDVLEEDRRVNVWAVWQWS